MKLHALPTIPPATHHARAARLIRTAVAVAALAAFVPAASAQWSVTILTPATGNGGSAFAGAGSQQVGINRPVSNNHHAVVWTGTAGSIVDLHPAAPTTATLSEADGTDGAQQVGYIFASNVNRASLWSGTAASRVDLMPPGAASSTARAIHNGQQIGDARMPGGSTHAGIWTGTAASWVDLNPAGASGSTGWSVHNGVQVGTANFSAHNHAGIWTGTSGSWVDLDPLGTTSEGYAVNGGQQVGLTLVDTHYHASLWSGTAQSWVDLHPVGRAPDDDSEARGVVGGVNGWQVGNTSNAGTPKAALWNGTAASYTDLHALLPAGFTVEGSSSSAYAIWNHEGTQYIAGAGFNAGIGRVQALLWKRPVPFVCRPDLGQAGGLPGPDTHLDNNDFIVFISYFFTFDPTADMGQAGGFEGSDTLFDNNDFIVYINLFFNGCP